MLGSLSEEREANQLMGGLYAKTGFTERAIECWIATGSSGAFEELAEDLPPRAVVLPVPPDLLLQPGWIRASAFAAARCVADRLSDDNAAAWAEAALTEVSPAPDWQADSPDQRAWLNAFQVLAQLADALSPERAGVALAIAEPLVQREPDQYRETDEAQVNLLASVARVHPGLRPAAVTQMCRALCLNDRLGGWVLQQGQASLRAEPGLVTELCARAVAERRDVRAAIALVLAGAVSPAVLDVARARVQWATAVQTHSGGSHSIMAGWSEEAFLASWLDMPERARFAERMAAIVSDSADVAQNRKGALDALHALGPSLDDPTRDRLHALAMRAVRGELDDGARMGRGGPLDRVRFDFGSETLRFAGLWAAARLARSPAQQQDVAAAGMLLLTTADAREQSEVMYALSNLPLHVLEGDLDALASHPSDSIRALAAHVWCSVGGVPPAIGARLAADPTARVRKALAQRLRVEDAFAAVRRVLQSDWSRSVRRLAAQSRSGTEDRTGQA